MICPTNEQLAQLALSGADENNTPHIQSCTVCESKLVGMRSTAASLAAAHRHFLSNLPTSRARLLAQLEHQSLVENAPGLLTKIASKLSALSPRQRIAAGGVGFSTALAMLLLVFVISSATPLSAMERMAKRLRAVTSFSYQLDGVSDHTSADGPFRITRNDVVSWRAPASFRAATKIVKQPLPPQSGPNELRVDIEEIYTPGQRGIFIDHRQKTFFRTPEFEPDTLPDFSPLRWMQRMSEGDVKVLRDLGPKQLNGTSAHGYVVSLGNPRAASGQNAIELWVDAATDLPIEFRYSEPISDRNVSDANSRKNTLRVYDCQWNTDIAPQTFDPIEPAGYENTTPPSSAQEIREVTDALRLYAELTGHYPRVRDFRAADLEAELLTLATSPTSTTAAKNEQLAERIHQARAGFDWLARVLRNQHHSGYYGNEVGPNAPDKILLWWPSDSDDSYFVIYGNLRTTTLPYSDWAPLVPPDIAESHAPGRYSKPDDTR